MPHKSTAQTGMPQRAWNCLTTKSEGQNAAMQGSFQKGSLIWVSIVKMKTGRWDWKQERTLTNLFIIGMITKSAKTCHWVALWVKKYSKKVQIVLSKNPNCSIWESDEVQAWTLHRLNLRLSSGQCQLRTLHSLIIFILPFCRFNQHQQLSWAFFRSTSLIEDVRSIDVD